MIFEEAMVMSGAFDEVLQQVKDAFAAEGFGTLTEIDMQATLAAKVGKEMGRYVIVGACNPHLASRALDVEPQIGVLLPCNVVVYEGDEAGTAVVAIMDPVMQLGVAGRADMRPMAEEVKARMERVLAAL